MSVAIQHAAEPDRVRANTSPDAETYWQPTSVWNPLSRRLSRRAG